jgi:hypothetical protein
MILKKGEKMIKEELKSLFDEIMLLFNQMVILPIFIILSFLLYPFIKNDVEEYSKQRKAQKEKFLKELHEAIEKMSNQK